ncbi:MAG: hypothetical protein IJO46_08020, partial [Thermoguttaceae bacterium]|nr:hypothetical protein [Thermoguttaceae bacterium]
SAISSRRRVRRFLRNASPLRNAPYSRFFSFASDDARIEPQTQQNFVDAEKVKRSSLFFTPIGYNKPHLNR